MELDIGSLIPVAALSELRPGRLDDRALGRRVITLTALIGLILGYDRCAWPAAPVYVGRCKLCVG